MLSSYVENVTDEDEFVLLDELNNSKEIYPFRKCAKFDLENMDEAQCKRQFRFLHSHIYDLKSVLNIPEKIVTCQRTGSSGVDALCILFKRLTFPCQYTDIVPTYGSGYNHETNIFYNQQTNSSMLMSYMKKVHHWKTTLVLVTAL